jgi:hypothetical protein
MPIFYVLLGVGIYVLLKRNPSQGRNMLLYANNIVKFMPIDKNSMDMLSPIMDFTSKNDTQRYEALFGVKGKWADCTKRDLVNTFMKTTNNGPCSLCVAGTLEQNYSPFEINNKSEKDLIVILQKVFMSCDVCKPQ